MSPSRRRGSAANRASSKNRSSGATAKANGTEQVQYVPDPVARALIRSGWSVIPQQQDRSGYFPWREFQSRRPTKGEVQGWAMSYPNAMWAVVTGQVSGVLVLDFDGDEGLATMESLGLKPLVRTPGGGAHVYVHAPDFAVRGNARVDQAQFPNMDLRADGQLATFYGNRSLKGGSYEKISGAPMYRFEDLPVQLQRLLRDWEKQDRQAPADVPAEFEDFESDDVLLNEAVAKVAEGGSRNQAGFELACQLRDERYAFDAAELVMVAFATAVMDVGSHPYPEQEAYDSLASAYSSPPRNPRALGRSRTGDGFAQTDYGNAERLVDRHGKDLRYSPITGWLVWDGRRWTGDETGAVERKAKATVRHIFRAAGEVEDAEQRAHLFKFAFSSESASRLKAMVTLAQTEEEMVVRVDQLDRDAYLLCCENGTVDLRTGELHSHDRSDLITRLAPVAYDPDAVAAVWEAFVEQVLPDPELRSFVQKAVGYSLTGDTSEHVALLLFGSGANGKSTFLEALREVLGDYQQQAPSDLLLSKKQNGGASPELARLRGARFITSVETDEGRQLAEAMFKQLTGGDRIAARELYKGFFEFTPTGKFWLATNHKPEVKGTGEAIWRRIRLVPFTVTVPQKDRDPKLSEKLRREKAGILRWAVDGALAWQAEGLGKPAAVAAATDEYRQEMDHLGRFIEDYCVLGAKEEATARELFGAFRMWAEEQGIPRPWSQVTLGKRLGEREGIVSKRVGHDKVSTWLGIGVRPRGAIKINLKSVK